MAVIDHIQTLKSKHNFLENKIHEEMKRPVPDAQSVYDLKREKLRVKEEISRLSHEWDECC